MIVETKFGSYLPSVSDAPPEIIRGRQAPATVHHHHSPAAEDSCQCHVRPSKFFQKLALRLAGCMVMDRWFRGEGEAEVG